MIVSLAYIGLVVFGLVMLVQRNTARTRAEQEVTDGNAAKAEVIKLDAQVEILLKAIDRMYASVTPAPVSEPEVLALRALPLAVQDGVKR